MSAPSPPAVRRAGVEDATAIGLLLHDFNREFDEPAPAPDVVGERMGELLASREITVLLVGDGPDGFAVLRFRSALCRPGLECYVAELYVVPARRGLGLGRALMEEAIELARREGAETMDLGTSEDDVAARALYESLGFRNRESGADGPIMYVYEREL